MTIVYIRENFKKFIKTNPISGYSWLEQGATINYSVIGGSGVFSTHKTIKQAEKKARELQDFYNKFDL